MKHEIAQQYLLMAQDGALSARDADALARHLRECAECRAVARELDELETQLRYRLKVRYPTVSSAEIIFPKARLKAAIPRHPVVRHYTPLAAGIAALVVLVSVLLYATQQFMPQETAVQQTSTLVAAIVTEVATQTAEPSLTPTDEPLPTATSEPLPTDEPTATNEPLPTLELLPTDTVVPTTEIEHVVTEPIAPLATAVPPTDVPPTSPPTLAPTATAIPATATPTIEPTEEAIDVEMALAQLDGYVAALNGSSTDAILNYFAEKTHYGTGEGRRTQQREELSAEFNALRALNSYFSLDKCRSNALQHSQISFTAACELTMTNDWRNALGLAPYVSQLAVSLDENLAIISLTDYQYRDGIATDWNRVQAFQQWLSTTYPSVQSQQMRGNPTNYLRHVNLTLLPYAHEWAAAGQP